MQRVARGSPYSAESSWSMQKTNSKYVIYRHVITGSYQVFETNDKKEAIRFIKSIRYQIIKKSQMDWQKSIGYINCRQMSLLFWVTK
jgi:hypothetical protein